MRAIATSLAAGLCAVVLLASGVAANGVVDFSHQRLEPGVEFQLILEGASLPVSGSFRGYIAPSGVAGADHTFSGVIVIEEKGPEPVPASPVRLGPASSTR